MTLVGTKISAVAGPLVPDARVIGAIEDLRDYAAREGYEALEEVQDAVYAIGAM